MPPVNVLFMPFCARYTFKTNVRGRTSTHAEQNYEALNMSGLGLN